MDLTSIEIGELIALLGLIGVAFKGWLVVQKDITRLDTDVKNLKDDNDKDRETFQKWFEKLESKIDMIINKHMK